MTEVLRTSLFEDRPWSEIDPEEIADTLIPQLYARCRTKKGGKPASNTLRGRYDAASAYFDFLVKTRRLEQNPCDFQCRPPSKANLQPFLEPSDDEKLARAPKEGHELAVYALTRGAGLREEEVCDLLDDDVDLENGTILIRGGKTGSASRRVPVLPTTGVLLGRYRTWRDENVTVSSEKFVQTRSGSISKGYVWKLVKALAAQAEVRLLRKAGKIVLNSDGYAVSEVTPHSLRRTFVTDLANRGVPTVALSAIIGHSSERVTEASYAMASEERAARQLILAAGEGPFSLADGLSLIAEEINQTVEAAHADPHAAVAELRRLQLVAADLERSLLGLMSEDEQQAA